MDDTVVQEARAPDGRTLTIVECGWDDPASREALALRCEVFVREQGVPEEIERDDRDPTSRHVIVRDAGRPVATGRLFEYERWGIVGRMAVVKSHRRLGLGGMVLEHLVRLARTRRLRGVVLHAQRHATGFYRRHGFTEEGEPFHEAGIEHIEMRVTFETIHAVAHGLSDPADPCSR